MHISKDINLESKLQEVMHIVDALLIEIGSLRKRLNLTQDEIEGIRQSVIYTMSRPSFQAWTYVFDKIDNKQSLFIFKAYQYKTA
jgi:hypothetical protein